MTVWKCFSEMIADVFPPWHRVNTHLNAAEQQSDKITALIDQLIKCVLLAAADTYLLFKFLSSKLVFQTPLLYSGFFFIKYAMHSFFVSRLYLF